MGHSGKLIINAALTGMVPEKQDNPHVPITPEEIAADARRCTDAGASILHLHARDGEGRPSCQAEIYGEILQRVRDACPDVILCVSTSGRVHKTFEERSAVLDDPAVEMASLTLGSLNFPKQESVNSPEMIRRLALRMRERGILPELEVFEIGMAEYVHYLLKKDVLATPLYCNILLGNLGTLGASALNLGAAVAALPQSTTWAAAGIGRFQQDVNRMAVEMGGHVRVGLEDNLWLDRERREPATNVRLIERIVEFARSMGRDVATPSESREIIGIASGEPARTLA
ncbi:MAG TPA: 3-keto-5-aminohexanoate cleavage protein [Phycisphaerae bacterium]|nr:3-keto-5-aminohexanoate cleavage protein [Phycisphaerae bacterium]